MNFAQALKCMDAGLQIRRPCWDSRFYAIRTGPDITFIDADGGCLITVEQLGPGHNWRGYDHFSYRDLAADDWEVCL